MGQMARDWLQWTVQEEKRKKTSVQHILGTLCLYFFAKMHEGTQNDCHLFLLIPKILLHTVSTWLHTNVLCSPPYTYAVSSKHFNHSSIYLVGVLVFFFWWHYLISSLLKNFIPYGFSRNIWQKYAIATELCVHCDFNNVPIYHLTCVLHVWHKYTVLNGQHRVLVHSPHASSSCKRATKAMSILSIA